MYPSKVFLTSDPDLQTKVYDVLDTVFTTWINSLPIDLQPNYRVQVLHNLERIYTSPAIISLLNSISSFETTSLDLWENAVIDYFNLLETQEGFIVLESFFQTDSDTKKGHLKQLSRLLQYEYVVIKDATYEYFISDIYNIINKPSNDSSL